MQPRLFLSWRSSLTKACSFVFSFIYVVDCTYCTISLPKADGYLQRQLQDARTKVAAGHLYSGRQQNDGRADKTHILPGDSRMTQDNSSIYKQWTHGDGWCVALCAVLIQCSKTSGALHWKNKSLVWRNLLLKQRAAICVAKISRWGVCVRFIFRGGVLLLMSCCVEGTIL